MATYVPRDKLARKAREKGLPSRAAFKLEEMLARHRLVKAGGRIVDLGCAPGGWLAILATAAGPDGFVVGVDLAQCRSPAPGVVTLVGDIRDAAVAGVAIEELGGRADLVTSDLSPKLSGVAARDQARARELVDAALEFAERCLKPGGAMVAKLFMGADFSEAVAEFKRRFGKVEVTRTRATRPGSSELYLIARAFHPRAA
jgi:23S rRNA (uridine2552-2'-O)-methyltransferase